MSETWLSCATVAGITGDAERTVRSKVVSGAYVSRRRQLGRRGRPQLEIGISSLAADAQMKFARRQLEAAECHALVPADPAQPTLFAPPAQIDIRAWSGLPEEQRAEAERRLQVITPLVEWNVGHRLAYMLRDGSPVRNSDQLAAYIGEQYSIGKRTVWSYYSAFKKEGAVGLVRTRRSDATRSKYFETHAEAAKFILAKYQELGQCSPTGSPNLALIHGELVREYPHMYPGEPHPAYSTVRNFLAGLPPVVRDAARLGRQAWNNRHAPYVDTDIAALAPLEIVVADHRIFDVLVYNDCFSSSPQYAAMRPWVTLVLDMRTRVIVGIAVRDNPSWRGIAAALRDGFATYGTPRIFYTDNGKDFQSSNVRSLMAKFSIE
jgi:hypothetical protein